ncbi:NLR family member X1 isoform X1 [Plectropomus leopardus]|uniref:NLR family member X1 isoform X1 n=1 Tax=Plectropomus leopardus TaxID=160734 RepID=UPI001C4A8CB4|nr:NLR family member X1 isoform X1 [Plectropomus leopardus]XP_042342220.1 NLR family member X1 isoform X1 [Plectropomus leopardus]XP_042342221.1 NLR family member X1 isoform X1 [Plectropomus leopardus]XP_042342222.1 NLR family member X1 isoform X1 [Plectropomus leopardus]XP_042342225.1 NLR family member X1 isoform X1 [Plectropomus leopardus]XP_042342226.1 NLR family member X1 isoform X1 [Plectropomus leopardus]
MSSMQRRLSQLLGAWRWKRRLKVSLNPATGFYCRTFCSSTAEPVDPIEIHRRKLFLWFSHLPQEEKQFGGYFSPETMHVDPLILERTAEEMIGLLSSPLQSHTSSSHSVTVEQLFEPTDVWSEGRGLNVLLYGAVGTGKNTVVRKLVLDWCSGIALTHFKLLVPFSCEDLGQLSKSASLRDLVSRKYLHLKKHPLLSGEGNQAKDVLFLFNGIEKMKLDFRIGATELCSDPNEALPPGVVVVNLLRKYLLPEASILVTTRLSALDRIPQKYVSRCAQICGFNDPDRQRAYFTSRLLQQSGETNHEAQALIELLYLNLQRESQLATACFLPSYCWLTCATLHFLHFTDAKAPIRTLTGIYTSFLRLNFGGEVLGKGTRTDVPIQEHHNSLMLYVVRTVGKLAFDGVTYKRTSFSEKELEQWIGGKTKTDEELRQLAVFRTDVLDFFLAPCVQSGKHFPEQPSENDERRYVFAVPEMQEYLAALYVVLGENKSALEKLTRQVSVAIGQASEDVSAIVNIFSKFIPLRIFAVFNLLKLFPKLYEKISSHNKGSIARTMAAEMFRTEDSYNEDVLDQVEQSLLGVHGPQPQQYSEGQPFELYPIFMGGLLHYGNRVLLQQLGCSIQSTTVAQITNALRKYLVRELSKPQPPEELMDLLVLLYEFQNPRLTAEVLASIRTIRLTNIRMTSLKCFILSSVLSCTPASYHLDELDLSSCLLTHNMLQMLWPAFRHTHNLNLQFNSLGPESCILLRDLLLDPKSSIRSLQLCDNPLLESGACTLLEAFPKNQSLKHLSLMHTGLGDQGALELAERLQEHTGLQELNVAYNNIGDNAALTLVDACREHPSVHTVHLYLNPLSDVGKQSLYVRGVPKSHSGHRVKVLVSVTEGSDISEDWHPILRVIRENASSWDRERVKQQLKVFLRDLEWGRQQQQSLWKRLHFRRVEKGVQQTLQMLEKDTLPSSTGLSK